MKPRHQLALVLVCLLALAPAAAAQVVVEEVGRGSALESAGVRAGDAPRSSSPSETRRAASRLRGWGWCSAARRGEALAAAQLELIREPVRITTASGQTIETDASAPFFWAAFELFGDWR